MMSTKAARGAGIAGVLLVVLAVAGAGLMGQASNQSLIDQEPVPSVYITSPREIYGILVGIENYPGNPLTYPNDDVAGIVDLFRSEFLAGWPSSGSNQYLSRIENSAGTVAGIAGAFDAMSTRVDGNDLLVFYFSGHGGNSTGSSIVMQDGTPVYPAWLANQLSRLPCMALVLLDSCFAGGFLVPVRGVGRCVMCACQFSETSLESGLYGHGIFTYAFMEAFTSHVDTSGNGYTSLGEAEAYATIETTDISTDLGKAQHPASDNQIGRDFELQQYLDSDGDGIGDVQEIASGTDPSDPESSTLVSSFVLSGEASWAVLAVLFVVFFLFLVIGPIRRKVVPYSFPPAMARERVSFVDDRVKMAMPPTMPGLSILRQNSTGTGERPGVMPLIANRGHPIKLVKPTALSMPLICAVTGMPVSAGEQRDFSVVRVPWRYVESPGVVHSMVQYEIVVPVSAAGRELLARNKERARVVLKFAKLLLVADTLLWVGLEFVAGASLATPVFLLGLLGLFMLVLFKSNHATSVHQFFTALRVNEGSIEIRIRNPQLETIFRSINNV